MYGNESENHERSIPPEAGASDAAILPVEPLAGDPTVAATLSYETPGNIQPPGSRFVCEILPNGVRLTEPPDAFRGWRIMAFGLIPALLGFVLCMATPSDGGGRIAVAAGLVMLLFAALLIGAGYWQGTQIVQIEASTEELSMVRPLQWPKRLRWKRAVVGNISVLSVSSSVTLKPYSRVLLRKRHSLPVVLAAGPQEECLWIAYVIRRAMGMEQPGNG
jgi:hypothetical protein